MGNKICLIGNAEYMDSVAYGQAKKVRLYLKKIKDEGYDCKFVNLERIKKHPFSVLLNIKKSIKENDRIVLITASRGCKYLIPFINYYKKRYSKIFILPLVGTSVLHYVLDKMTDEEKVHFLVNKNYDIAKKNVKLSNQLSLIDFILPETSLLSETFSSFYGLHNTFTLTNFREIGPVDNTKFENGFLNLVFLSRVSKDKGIFDLLKVVEEINSFSPRKIKLDIYGKKEMSDAENELFSHFIDDKLICYCGPIENDSVIGTVGKYDLFVFPTHFVGEGVPGVIVESLIGGTPVLSSLFPQAPFILNENFDSLFFKMFDNNDMKDKLIAIINSHSLLSDLSRGAKESGKKYTYMYNRNAFLKYICGMERK